MTRRRLPSRRRGVTIIEAVLIVVVLALAIPPMLGWLNQAADDRVDAVNTARATVLASSVLETVLADVAGAAPGLGFAALANASAYTDTPTTGLRARLAGVTQPYQALGMSFSLSVGPLVSSSGSAAGVADQDVFRLVQVTVTFPSARSGSRSLTVGAMVTQL